MYHNILSECFDSEQIELIEKASLEKAIANNILTNEETNKRCPGNLVDFYEEWKQQGKKLDGCRMIVDNSAEYLHFKGYDLANIENCIEHEKESYLNRILSVMPILVKADVIKEGLPEFSKSEYQEIDKVINCFEENYFAADIFTSISKSMAAQNPDMKIEERFEKSLEILRAAEDEYYNQPIVEENLLQEIYSELKTTMKDTKEMVNAINDFTEKGKAAVKKIFHKNDNSNSKSR